MALAKYYEDILERLNDNIDSVKLLSKEENRNFISDERWNQIIAALNKQIVKAESIINKIRNDNNQRSLSLGHRLTELESENEQLRAENNELTQKISQIAEIVKIGSLFKIQETNIEPEYLQAVIYKQDTKKSRAHIYSLSEPNGTMISYSECPMIKDYAEGSIINIKTFHDNNRNVIESLSLSEDIQIHGLFERFEGSLYSSSENDITSVLYDEGEIFVPERLVGNHYDLDKLYSVLCCALKKQIVDKHGKIYDWVAVKNYVF